MSRNTRLWQILTFATLIGVAAPMSYAADKVADKTTDKEAEKPAVPATAPKTEAKLPESYKAGNLEISQVYAAEKSGAIEIYLAIKNNGKADDGLSSAELTEGSGDIVTVTRVTTKEVTNQEAIKKAQDEVAKIKTEAPPEPKDAKDAKMEKAEKVEAPKLPDIPKPEYKDVVKDVENTMIPLVAGKATTLEPGEAHLKLTGYKPANKNSETMSVMLHFRSSPNATVKVKLGSKASFIGKLLGQ